MITSFRNFFKKSLQNQLITGSTVLFFGSSIASFGNYLFHLLMGRMLGPVDYGILASLNSLLYLSGIPLGALSLVVVRYVSALRGKKDFGAIGWLYSWLNKKLAVFSLGIFILLTVVSPSVASFLHLESVWLVWLILIFSLIGFFQTISAAVLQGFLRFSLMSVLGIILAALKLGLAVFLVWLGGKVWGAVGAILIISLVGFCLTVFFAARLLKKPRKKIKIDVQELVRYAVPAFLSTLAFTSLYTNDVVLARHFLPAREAGFYAALSTLGKIIFFAVSPIVAVMFPMVSERHANGKKYLELFNLSWILIFMICLVISLIYWFFPELMVKLLFGKEYLAISPCLFLFAIFMSLYSSSFLLVNFYLSVKRVKVVVLPVLAAALQLILIYFWHQSLSQIVEVSIGILSLLLLSLLGYHLFKDAKIKKAFAFGHCPCLQAGKNNC